MYRTIVVGTDGSATASEAVHQAIELAKATGARLHMVNAYKTVTAATAVALTVEPSSMTVFAGEGDWLQVTREETEAQLRRCGGWATDVGVEAELHACPGQPAEAIVAVAEQCGADLIIVGDKGMAGVRRFLTGSVPNTVAHHAPCTVMIVNSTTRVKETASA